MCEWVPSMSSRKKWYQLQKNLQIGNTVLLISCENPRAYWPLGKVYHGYVCSVKLQVGDKQFVRPIVKLCSLELSCSD